MIRDYDCVFVNYTQVLSVKKQGDSTLIVFDDLTEISIPTSINKVKIQIKKCKLINNFVKDNIFV
jgi:transposase